MVGGVELSNLEQRLINLFRDKTIVWEELPKSSVEKCSSRSSIQWEELPKTSLDEFTDGLQKYEIQDKDVVTMALRKEYVVDSEFTKVLTSKDNEILMPEDTMQLEETLHPQEEMAKSFQQEEPFVVALSSKNKDSLKQEHILEPLQLSPCDESNMTRLASSCPYTSSIKGIPSISQLCNQTWSTNYKPSGVRQIKHNGSLIKEILFKDEIKAMTALTPTCPQFASIPGFPSASESTVICYGASGINLFPSCPVVASMAGFPSLQKADSKNGSIIQHLILEKNIKRFPVVLLETKGIHSDMEGVVSLAQSCPTQSSIYGFPSHPQRSMVSLSYSWSKMSKIPGFISCPDSKEWTQKKKHLFTPKLKQIQILPIETCRCETRAMKGMVYLAPSCPKVTSIPGFPSIPQGVYYGLNPISLVPLCPPVSAIPGFPSLERDQDQMAKLTGESPLIQKPNKKIQFGIFSPQVNLGESDNMISLVPSCPRAARNPGFPSVPRYNMNSLAPICPKLSRGPGFLSFERDSKFNWISDHSVTLCNRFANKIAVVTDIPNVDLKMSSIMVALAPSCPEASSIFGFPSASRTFTKTTLSMTTLVPCCPSVSVLQGFASLTTFASPERLISVLKPIWVSPEKRPAEIMLPAGHFCPRVPNEASMVKLVMSCPKEARVRGFPSAPIFNRPPNMTSLYACAPCVSCVPGCPSARMLNTEWDEPAVLPNWKPLFERQLNTKMCVPLKHELKQDTIRYVIEMAPTCPQSAKVPGFPSILQLNETPLHGSRGSEELVEIETKTHQVPSSECSEELPQAESETALAPASKKSEEPPEGAATLVSVSMDSQELPPEESTALIVSSFIETKISLIHVSEGFEEIPQTKTALAPARKRTKELPEVKTSTTLVSRCQSSQELIPESKTLVGSSTQETHSTVPPAIEGSEELPQTKTLLSPARKRSEELPEVKTRTIPVPATNSSQELPPSEVNSAIAPASEGSEEPSRDKNRTPLIPFTTPSTTRAYGEKRNEINVSSFDLLPVLFLNICFYNRGKR